jgi:DNA-binding ferritin-like protein (Dps family)
MAVLGEKYLRDLRNGMTPLEWDVEVMNKRLNKLPNSFYTSFNEEGHGVWTCSPTTWCRASPCGPAT